MLALAAACGGDSGGDGDGDGDNCGFPDSSDQYLPYDLGYSWTYRVTDLGGGGTQTNKTQSVADAEVTDDDFPGLSFFQQETSKFGGRTVNLFTREGNTLLRHKQDDFDELDVFERTTLYQPAKIRLDESRVEAGTMFEEMYTSVITDAAMVTVNVDITESWEVIGTDVPCSSPFGEFTCLQIRRIRTVGGTANKDFYFALGIGKVREEGTNQLEELVDCSP